VRESIESKQAHRKSDLLVPFDDDAEYKRPNKIQLTSAATNIPEPRKRRFISAVKKRAKKREHAKQCAKRRRK